MDVVAAIFVDDSSAVAAARELAWALELDDAMVTVEHVDASAADHAGAPVVIAYVPGDRSSRAREVISNHSGRHVPLDWIQGASELVVPETFPPAGRGGDGWRPAYRRRRGSRSR